MRYRPKAGRKCKPPSQRKRNAVMIRFTDAEYRFVRDRAHPRSPAELGFNLMTEGMK